IFGSDDRVRISPTMSYPFRAIGYLFTQYPSLAEGYGKGCSATLIGTRYLLTAAHCLYNEEAGEWSTHVTFYPGMDGDRSPYGSFAAQTWSVPSGYINSPDRKYDGDHMNYDIGLV